jgi:hypothetical protein
MLMYRNVIAKNLLCSNAPWVSGEVVIANIFKRETAQNLWQVNEVGRVWSCFYIWKSQQVLFVIWYSFLAIPKGRLINICTN